MLGRNESQQQQRVPKSLRKKMIRGHEPRRSLVKLSKKKKSFLILRKRKKIMMSHRWIRQNWKTV
jgi:hypothetical protein